jgi:hypothetical protein
MVSLERHRDIRAFHLLMGIYNSGWPAPEPREFIPRASPESEEPPQIIEEFTLELSDWEITPSGPRVKPP